MMRHCTLRAQPERRECHRTACKAEADESEEAFEAKLKKIAKAKPKEGRTKDG